MPGDLFIVTFLVRFTGVFATCVSRCKKKPVARMLPLATPKRSLHLPLHSEHQHSGSMIPPCVSLSWVLFQSVPHQQKFSCATSLLPPDVLAFQCHCNLCTVRRNMHYCYNLNPSLLQDFRNPSVRKKSATLNLQICYTEWRKSLLTSVTVFRRPYLYNFSSSAYLQLSNMDNSLLRKAHHRWTC